MPTNGMDDPKLFKEIQEHAADMERTNRERNLKFDEYEEAYLLKWVEKNKAKYKKYNRTIVQSPDARNQVLGAVRLMIATDPIIRIKQLSEDADFDADQMEKWLAHWWTQCERMTRRPLLADAVLSGILYGEMHFGVTPLADMIERVPEKRRKRIERKKKMTPVLIENWNPRYGYMEQDQFDLSAYYRKVELPYHEIQSRFGELVPENAKKKRYDTTTLHMFYDLDYCCYWIDNHKIYLDTYDYDEIPISVSLIDGSSLFDKPEERNQPMLYGMMESGIHNVQNLALTVFYNVIFGLGANALFKHVSPTAEEKRVVMNFNEYAGVVEMVQGESFEPLLNRNLIPPELMEAYSLAVQKGHESTIYPQAFGAPINRNTTFSEMSLLAQSGRLPLVSTQKSGSMGIAKTIEIALMVLKKAGERIEFDKKKIDIPDDLQVDVTLDVKLPQDKLQLANIAHLMKTDMLADDDWIQNNILHITDSKGVKRAIWKQQASDALFMSELQQNLRRLEAQKNPPPMDMAGQQAGGMGMPPEMMMPQQQMMPPEMMMGGQPGMSPDQGMLAQGGLPPQQAGMMPGAGQGMMPPEEEVM